jgi:IMP cyclohydrolase
MFEIEMKAGKLGELITKMTVRSGGASLMTPVLVNVDPKAKTMEWRSITSDHTCFAWGRAEKLKLKGDADDYVFDGEIVDWLSKLFGADETIKMTHHGSSIKFEGDKYKANLIPTDFDAAKLEAASRFKIEDGIIILKGMDFNEIKMKASELNSIISPTSLVYGAKDIKVVRFNFGKDGSTAIIGSIEAHDVGVERKIEAKVKKSLNITLGNNLAEVVSILDGDISIFGCASDKPIWLRKSEDNFTVGYLIAHYDETAAKEAKEEEPTEDAEEEEEPKKKSKKPVKKEEEEPEEEEPEEEASELDLGDEDD